MKGLVVGNSHVGALRLAKRHCPQSVSIDYLSLPGGNGPKLRFQGRKVLPGDNVTMINAEPKALAEGADLSTYDFVIFSALGLAAPRANNPEHLLNRYLVAGFSESSPQHPVVSRGFMAEMIDAALRRIPAKHGLYRLAETFTGPIMVQPFPIANALLSTRGPDVTMLPTRYGATLWKFQGWYYRAQFAAMRALLLECGDHVRLLDYPEPGWLDAGFTPEAYAQGRDCWHMNAEYGTRVFDQVLDALKIDIPDRAMRDA